MYIHLSLHEENVHNNCLMGLIFSTSWRVAPTKIKFFMGIWIFQKGFKSNRFQVVVWSQNLSFFYLGFPAKFWGFRQNLDICIFLFRISSQIWRFMASLALTVLKPSHAIDLLPAGCEVKSESDPFLVLYFSWNLYMLYIMYIPLLLCGGKSAQQLSYGFNILDKLESCPHENQIPYGDMDFSKKVSKVTDFR